jgi:hypothetical protein
MKIKERKEMCLIINVINVHKKNRYDKNKKNKLK